MKVKPKLFDREILVNTVINQLQKDDDLHRCMVMNVLNGKQTIKQQLTMDFFYVLKTLTKEEKVKIHNHVFDIPICNTLKDIKKPKSDNKVSINDELNQKYEYPNDEYYWSNSGWRYKKELFILEDDGKFRSYSECQLPPKKRCKYIK